MLANGRETACTRCHGGGESGMPMADVWVKRKASRGDEFLTHERRSLSKDVPPYSSKVRGIVLEQMTLS
jgi:cytochrome c5